jgi:hypothetical protein
LFAPGCDRLTQRTNNGDFMRLDRDYGSPARQSDFPPAASIRIVLQANSITLEPDGP